MCNLISRWVFEAGEKIKINPTGEDENEAAPGQNLVIQ
jgi:hypothetical protein